MIPLIGRLIVDIHVITQEIHASVVCCTALCTHDQTVKKTWPCVFRSFFARCVVAGLLYHVSYCGQCIEISIILWESVLLHYYESNTWYQLDIDAPKLPTFGKTDNLSVSPLSAENGGLCFFLCVYFCVLF